MKKLFLLGVLTISSLGLSARQVNAGLKAGFNFAQMRFTLDNDSHTTDMAVGFQAGAYMSFAVSDFFSIQPEVLFNRVGGKDSETDPDSGDDVSVKYKLDYLSIPVMFKFKVAENFNLQVGPQVGFMTAANAKVEFNGQSGDVSVSDAFKSIDLGGNLGLGFTFDRIGIDARYQFGFINILDNGNEMLSFGEGVKAFNRSIQVAVSYRLTNN